MELSSEAQFSLSLIATLLVFMVWKLWGVNWGDYFKTRTGLGILKGIVIVMVLALGMVLLTGCRGTYLNDASIFAGLDVTKKPSPSCVEGTIDDRTTSNIGLRGNLYQSEDKKFRTNLKYTHHSCAFAEDDAQYDAIGFELEYKISDELRWW